MNKSILMAICLTGLLIVWMLSGNNNSATPLESTKETVKNELMSVVITPSIAQLVSKKITVQGQVEANRIISMKTEISGKVTELPKTLGSRVKQGEVLVKVGLKTRLTDREEAVARVQFQKQELAAAKTLFERKLESGNRLSREKANLAAAKATLEKIDYEIKNASIIAPFAGVFDRRYVELGDYLDKGQAVVSLVDDLQLKITAMVPQQQVENLRLGQTVIATLINGEELTGPLNFISATSDKNTRSYRIEVLIDNSDLRRIVGMTASLTIPVNKTHGHLVSASAISLDKQGRLQVKAIDNENTVVSYVVEIVRTDADKVWLSGLPQELNLITLGQDFVVPGQKVNPNEQG
jgi:multidrug efflux system membrane fusion protein